MGRKRKTPKRVASTLRALHTFDHVTAEKKRAERAQALVERLKARAEAKALRELEKPVAAADKKARKEYLLGVAAQIVEARKEDAPGVVAELLQAYESPPVKEPPKVPEPERAYVVTGKDANNEPVRHYLPPVQPAAPVVEKPAPPASVTPKSIFPIWIQEARPATRKEWWAHQRARLPRPSASFGMPDSEGNTTHMQANGVRAGAGSDPRTCYLAGSYGQYNWKKDYL